MPRLYSPLNYTAHVWTSLKKITMHKKWRKCNLKTRKVDWYFFMFWYFWYCRNYFTIGDVFPNGHINWMICNEIKSCMPKCCQAMIHIAFAIATHRRYRIRQVIHFSCMSHKENNKWKNIKSCPNDFCCWIIIRALQGLITDYSESIGLHIQSSSNMSFIL